jgi:hypothetical protein
MKRNDLLIVLFLISGLLNFLTSCHAQPAVQKWQYKSSRGEEPYYLQREWLKDSVFVDKYFFKGQDAFWRDTFYVRNNECYFKRGKVYYSYMSGSSFAKGDTVVYYESRAVDKANSFFMIREVLIPVKEQQPQGDVLVYKLVDPHDDPKYVTNKLYFDTRRYLITRMSTTFGERTLIE